MTPHSKGIAPGDPSGIREALAKHGVQIPPLQVQHAGPEGTIFRFDIQSTDAVPTWERIRPWVDEIGYYPVVCRDEHGTLAELPEEINGQSPDELLRLAGTIDVAKWFDARVAGDREYYGQLEQGEWDATAPQSGWTIPFDTVTGKPVDGVWIALVPTTRPWEVLAFLRYGGWNECPAAEEHVAIHRYWHDRYRAEVVCLAGDTVEMRVGKPPEDRAGALNLAREQFIYSGGDLVYQGYETLHRLASALVRARYWFFWWD